MMKKLWLHWGIEPWFPAWKATALSMQLHERNRRVDTINLEGVQKSGIRMKHIG